MAKTAPGKNTGLGHIHTPSPFCPLSSQKTEQYHFISAAMSTHEIRRDHLIDMRGGRI